MADGYRTEGTLCLILLTYIAPLDEVDAQLKAHVDWLEVGFDEGVFLIAGRRNPRSGGVIVVRGTADAVTAVAKSDPFVTSGVASFEVVPFNASFAAPEIAQLLQ
ncbi:MAG: YciI family protein [Sphingomonas sp.]